jgi:signal recognition particle subunit SRP54
MFESLSTRLSNTIERIKGQGRLTEENIKDTIRDVRMALLEADVALPAVKSFIELVKERALGTEIIKSVNPGQTFVKIVSETLKEVMGKDNEPLNLKAAPPVVILLAGLQGSGKTTSRAKLAK